MLALPLQKCWRMRSRADHVLRSCGIGLDTMPARSDRSWPGHGEASSATRYGPLVTSHNRWRRRCGQLAAPAASRRRSCWRQIWARTQIPLPPSLANKRGHSMVSVEFLRSGATGSRGSLGFAVRLRQYINPQGCDAADEISCYPIQVWPPKSDPSQSLGEGYGEHAARKPRTSRGAVSPILRTGCNKAISKRAFN